MPQFMPPLALEWGLPLSKTDWPQDHLKVPNGYGMMPGVDVTNAAIGREYFVLGGAIFNWSYGETQTLTLNAPRDGDFWMTSFNLVQISAAGNVTMTNAFFVTVQDILSQYNLYEPYTDGAYLSVFYNTTSANLLIPRTQEFIQPYPLLRNGALKITIFSDPYTGARIPSDIYFAACGWKEYANAAF